MRRPGPAPRTHRRPRRRCGRPASASRRPTAPAEPGDRLQLVQRAARVSQPAAAHLGDPAAAGRHQRRDHQRRLVPHAARRVLVRDGPRPAQPFARPSVAIEQRLGLPVGHAAPDDGHQECRQLLVADGRGQQELQLVALQLAAVALAGDQRDRPSVRQRPPGSSGSCSPAMCWSTVAPTSANDSPSCRRPIDGRPTMWASSRPCSREWSVDGVVGSQPWSEVRISRSPCCSAESSRGRCLVELRQAVGEPLRVVAMPPDHVGLDQVDEHEAPGRGAPASARSSARRPARSTAVGVERVDVLAGEDVGDLAHPVHRQAGLAEPREVVRPRRRRASSRGGRRSAA